MILEVSFAKKESWKIFSEGSIFAKEVSKMISKVSYFTKEGLKMVLEVSFAEKEVSFFIKEPSEMFLFDHVSEIVSKSVTRLSCNRTMAIHAHVADLHLVRDAAEGDAGPVLKISMT